MCFPSLGETEDTTIADIRRGAQRRADQDRPRPRALTDRVGMYNQLLLIEE
jgi:enolase